MRLLERPRAALFVIATSTLLVAPSLISGRAADDYIHALILRGQAAEKLSGFDRSPLDIFRFTAPAYNDQLLADGVLPWWTDPQSRMAFFRPLSAATHWLDYMLWPESAFAMHLHSLAWFLFALVGAFAVYRSFLNTRWIAALALALYGFDGARGPTIGWLANRNAIIACAFSMWSLYFYHRGVRGPRWARWASPCAFALALLAGEAGIAGAAYLFAYAVFLDSGSKWARARRLLPHALVGVLWLGVERALGYGVARSGEYFDPFRNFGAYISALPTRFVALLGAEIHGAWSDWFLSYDSAVPGLSWVVWGVSLALFAGLAWVIVPLLRRRSTARFWVLASLLAVLPSAAAFPADRLLMLVGVGVMGLLAEVFAACVRPGYPARLPRLVGMSIFVVHLVIAPLTLPARSTGVMSMRGLLERADASVPAGPEVRQQTFIYVNPPSDAFLCFEPATRLVDGTPKPRTQRWLATGISDVKVHRIDSHTLAVTPEAGFLSEHTERIFRSQRHPLRLGDVVRLPGMQVEITAVTEDHRPARARFHFSHPLEDERYVWLIYKDDDYEPFDLPAVGETRIVPKVDFKKLFDAKYHPVLKHLVAHPG